MLNDSGIEIDQDFIDSFLIESMEVLHNLKIFVNSFESASDNHYFEKYGQQVDRIMGAAFTLSLNEIGELTKLGKELGYKASQVHDINKLISVQSILSQLNRALESIFLQFKNRKRPDYTEYNLLQHKLKSASGHLGDFRTTVGL